MKVFLIYCLLGFAAGLISGIFFVPLTWQYWALTSIQGILCLVIDYFFFKRNNTEIPNEGK